MTTTQTRCCEKCMPKRSIENGIIPACLNNACSCHKMLCHTPTDTPLWSEVEQRMEDIRENQKSMNNQPVFTPTQTPQWEKEFREYFDKTLKPKKPTMKNLDREIIVDFIKGLLKEQSDKTTKNIGFLRQWLNEDRKCTPMITNEDIIYWLNL